MKLAYDETADALNTRIRAHVEFSSLKIEDVLIEHLAARPAARVLDVGCGSGNYTPLFAARCDSYVGMDRGEGLLADATRKCEEAGLRNALFMQWDMNVPFPFVENTFDLVFFGYSAYYVDDVAALIDGSRRVLRPGGTLCIVGPVAGNAVELDRLTERLFGKASSAEKEARLHRLEREFVPIIHERFGDADVGTRDFSLVFPDVEEYRRYYLAAPQLIEVAREGKLPAADAIDAAIRDVTDLRLTKKSLFIWARKH